MNNLTGNQTQNDDLFSVLLALKDNIFRTLKCSDLGIVQNVSNDGIQCKLINNDNVVIATKLQDVEVQKDDVVLITFIDSDFRTNLKRLKLGQQRQIVKSAYHNESFGVITGIVYRGE